MAKTFLFFIRKVLEIVGVDMFLIYNHIGGKQLHTENYDAVIGFDESLSRYISALLHANALIGYIVIIVGTSMEKMSLVIMTR